MDVSPRQDETATEDGHHGAEPEGRPGHGATRPVASNSTESDSRRERLDRAVDDALTRYAEALERLGQ